VSGIRGNNHTLDVVNYKYLLLTLCLHEVTAVLLPGPQTQLNPHPRRVIIVNSDRFVHQGATCTLVTPTHLVQIGFFVGRRDPRDLQRYSRQNIIFVHRKVIFFGFIFKLIPHHGLQISCLNLTSLFALFLFVFFFAD
jgi:hypothetical protein